MTYFIISLASFFFGFFFAVFFFRHQVKRISRYKDAVFCLSQLKLFGGVSHKAAVRMYCNLDAHALHTFPNCPDCGYPFEPAWGCKCQDDPVPYKRF